MKTLILDNDDSFTYNLHQYVGELGGNPTTWPSKTTPIEKVREFNPTHLILSPGPGTVENPDDFGIGTAVIAEFGASTPLLGVCLGHQGIIHHFGGKIIHAPEVMHGKKSQIHHDGQGIFTSIPSPLTAMRYHSLIGEKASLPKCLTLTATTEDGLIMGVRHHTHPIEGIQFHPESIGTPTGKTLIKNFLAKTRKL